MELTWRIIKEEVEGENGEKLQGLRSIIGRYKLDRGWLRIVNGEDKELIWYNTWT